MNKKRYDNDDLSRFAGADYSEGQEGNWNHPGISGGTTNDLVDFEIEPPKAYKREEDRIHDEVLEALMSHLKVDAADIGVKVTDGVVYLTGKVRDRQVKKQAEYLAENIPGVVDIRNELNIFKGVNLSQGPETVTQKDLGIS